MGLFFVKNQISVFLYLKYYQNNIELISSINNFTFFRKIMPIVRSISGLRATIDDSLTPELIVKYANALSVISNPGFIVVGSDGRPSGEFIKNIFVGTLIANGREVWDLGVVPTPTVQLFAEHTDAIAGVAITASHNPIEWNGLKFINSSGIFFDKIENEKLWDAVDYSKSDYKFNISVKNKIINDSLEKHLEYILKSEYLNSDIIQKIKARKLKVVVDAVNASGSIIVPMLLYKLGIEVIELYCDGTGIFPHTPEPLPQNLTALAQSVKDNNADIGIAVDPDGDRLVLIDENGDPIGEERTIALAVEAVFKNSKKSEKIAVVNHSTSRLIEDIADKYNGKVFRSPVGEINVVLKMKETGAIIGGEGSGGVILPEVHYGRDSLCGIALLMNLMSDGKKLSEIVKDYPEYSFIKSKKEFAGSIDSIIEKIKIEFAGENILIEDGVKVIFPKSWVQLRVSNTEPIVRIMAESSTYDESKELISRISILF